MDELQTAASADQITEFRIQPCQSMVGILKGQFLYLGSILMNTI